MWCDCRRILGTVGTCRDCWEWLGNALGDCVGSVGSCLERCWVLPKNVLGVLGLVERRVGNSVNRVRKSVAVSDGGWECWEKGDSIVRKGVGKGCWKGVEVAGKRVGSVVECVNSAENVGHVHGLGVLGMSTKKMLGVLGKV